MDAPNGPNLANPNEQEPAAQNQDQVPVGQAPAQGPAQITQNVLVQPVPQLIPVQPALLVLCPFLRLFIKTG